MNNNYQIISVDIGRGYVKAFTVWNDEEKEFKFKAVIGDSRNIDLKEYENPIFLDINSREYFVGELAEKESYTSIKNTSDSKVSQTAKVLLYTCLNELAQTEHIKIMLGVPYDNFSKSIMREIKEVYKNQEIITKDKVKNTSKRIIIDDINIYREADASMFYIVKNKSNTKPTGVIYAGFKTTELAYYDRGFKFNDSKSKTIPYGCMNALFIIQKRLQEVNIKKELNEIDTETEYDDMKVTAFELMSEKISQKVDEAWRNIDEMEIYITGGNSLNMTIDKRFKLVENPQMTTAKGLYIIAEEIYA